MKSHIKNLEVAISKIPENSNRDRDFHAARRSLQEAIRIECGGTGFPNGLSLTKHIEIAMESKKGGRITALLLLRCLEVQNLIPENNSQNSIDRKIIELCKSALPDLDKELEFSKKRQTYEAIDLIKNAFPNALRELSSINFSTETLEAFRQACEQLIKCLRNKQASILLQPYNAVSFVGVLTTTVSSIKRLINTSSSDPMFVEHLQNLSQAWDESRDATDYVPSFLFDSCIKSFSESFQRIVSTVTEESFESFKCPIKSRLPAGGYTEKNYPIKEEGREFSILIPMANEGPGLARNVRASIVSNEDQLILNDGDAVFGDVRPGQFSFSTMVMVAEPIRSAKLTVHVHWEDVSGESTHEILFDVSINAQNPDVNWSQLKTLQPYRRVAATGDEFVGRDDKLSPLCAGLSGPSAQSAYIWGQKRVGKTSLAHAVTDFLENGGFEFEPIVHIFEWGDVAANSPEDSIMNIGEEISAFIDNYMSEPTGHQKQDFASGLRPLVRQVRAIHKEHPNKRFIIVFDEFDELHSAMYRYGPIAEAFFSNIRSLEGQPNLGLLFVGGENMPFVIAAQGDQLNKLDSFRLDYFDRAREWNDYVDMIRNPVEGEINWLDSAINRLFEETNGHPYFSKLLAARIFSSAVSDRDTEITAHEVNRAIAYLAANEDINAFSHIWKDGINVGNKGDEFAEVVSLQRCRVLVAIGRVLRAGEKITIAKVKQCREVSSLSEAEINKIIHEFCQRGLMREAKSNFEFVLKVFEKWLAEKGVSLVTDTLGDEFSDQLQRCEDNAYVTADEIIDLTEKWPDFKMQPISSDQVRKWLQQCPHNTDQRILFDLLKSVRFISDTEIRSGFGNQKTRLQEISPFTKKKLSDRRNDVLVTYVDGVGKSGAHCARLFANGTEIANNCIVEMSQFDECVLDHEKKTNRTINGVVVVDDMIGTGNQLSKNLKAFFEKNLTCLAERNATVLICTYTATDEGEQKVRELISKIDYDRVDLHVCEGIQKESFAFREATGIWKTSEDFYKAKQLCQNLGVKVSKNAPLGYGGKGLLLTFSRNCPNNSLPILFQSKAAVGWQALFPRENA